MRLSPSTRLQGDGGVGGVGVDHLSVEHHPGHDEHRPGQHRPGRPVRDKHQVAEGHVGARGVSCHHVARVDDGDGLHLQSCE